MLCLAVVHGMPVLILSSHLSRAPSHDSAIIRSDRLDGNFAYSTADEAHIYATVTSVVDQMIVTSVAVSYVVPAPTIPFTPTSAYTLESAN